MNNNNNNCQLKEYKGYYCNDNLYKHCFYNECGLLVGEYKEYNIMGRLHKHYFYNEYGQLVGEYKKYHENGELATHCFYQNNNMVGQCNKYIANGQLFEQCFYQNDHMIEYKSYHLNGLLQNHCFYNKDAQLTGEYKLFHPNGQTQRHCLYHNNICWRYRYLYDNERNGIEVVVTNRAIRKGVIILQRRMRFKITCHNAPILSLWSDHRICNDACTIISLYAGLPYLQKTNKQTAKKKQKLMIMFT